MTGGEQPPKKTSLPSVFERAAAESTEPWVKIWLSEKTSRGNTDIQKIFRASAIEGITSFPHKEGVSRLHLYNGKVVPVMMDADKLWEKIYQPDFRGAGEPVSLLDVTGAQAFPAPPTPEIGKLIEGEGIFIGQYQRLSKIFNVFAAPEDLPGVQGYTKTLDIVATLKNWYGQNGAAYVSDENFYAVLENENYEGNWIIPPFDILKNNVFACKSAGALKGAFQMTGVSTGNNHPVRYWSSTLKGQDAFRKTIDFMNGDEYGNHGDNLSCRLVRLVEVKP